MGYAKVKPRVCVLTTTPLVIHFFLKPHLRALAQHFDVTVACNPKNDAYLPPLDLSVRQVAVSMQRKISLLGDLVALFELYRLFRHQHFDLVVSVTPKAGLLGILAAFLAGVPRRVHIFQGEVWASKRGFMRALLKFMDYLVVKSATHVLAVSFSERQFLEEQGVTRPGQVQVLGAGSICGVDTTRFRPDTKAKAEIREQYGIPDDAVVCLFLGRLTADKGVFDLVRAYAECADSHPDLWLILVGPDEENIAPGLCALAGDAFVQRMVIDGFTNQPQRFIAASDFLCLPSYREGFGMVVIEAAAAGVPSIGSRIYGVSDALVEGETGVLVQPGNVGQLSAALAHLCEDGALRARLARAARLRVENEFRQDRVVARYVEFFRGLWRENNAI